MKSKVQIPFCFDAGRECIDTFVQFEKIISDRGSKYSVSGGTVRSREDIQKFLKHLKRKKSYQKATHNTWAARVTKEQGVWDIKNDDGETGAGNVLLRVLQKEDIRNTVVVVTRWYGGIKLHGDRFKHVQDAAKYFIEHGVDSIKN